MHQKLEQKLIAIEEKVKEKLHEYTLKEKTMNNEKIEDPSRVENDIVAIDCITKDAVRRIKLPGTQNKKDTNQVEDRLCRIIYVAPEYNEAKNNKAFAQIKPSEKIKEQAKAVKELKEIGMQPKLPEGRIKEIIESNPKIKALYMGNIEYLGKSAPLVFKNGKNYLQL